jgi:hypothetical protein
VGRWLSSETSSAAAAAESTTYVVLGCGKTGMDAVVHLVADLKVPPERVAWVISRDVWIINRMRGGPSAYHQELLERGGNHEATMDALEAKNLVHRLDPNVRPTAPFRFPTISGSELKVLRSVTNKIRHGRVKAISLTDDKQFPRLVFEDGSDVVLNDSHVNNTVFVHCTSPGPFNGRTIDSIYSEDGKSLKMTLFPILPPPIPLSGAMLAAVETSRRNGTLDAELGNTILSHRQPSDLDPKLSPSHATPTHTAIWKKMIRPYLVLGGSPDAKGHFDVHWNLAAFLAMLDKDPTVGADWLSKGNRLSIYSWIQKLRSYENVHLMIDQAKAIGYTEDEVRTLQLLADKLAPLQGR